MIKEYEVYGNKWFGKDDLVEVVELLQQKKFPTLDHSRDQQYYSQVLGMEASIQSNGYWERLLR
jgi:hypothetical protein